MKMFRLNGLMLCVLMAMVAWLSSVAQEESVRERGLAGGTARQLSPSDRVLISLKSVAATEEMLAATEKKVAEMKQHLAAAPPKREITILEGPAEKVKLFRPDPKLLENKVIATFDLLVDPVRAEGDIQAGQDGANSRGIIRSFELRLANPQSREFSHYPPDLRELIGWEGGLLMQPSVFNGNSLHDQVRPTSKQFQQFLEHCDANEKPSTAELAFLVSGEGNDGLVERSIGRSRSSGSFWHYRVFARSAAEAQKRAETLLQLVDCGVRRPMQRFHLSQAEIRLAESKKEIQEAVKQAAVLQKEEDKLTKPSEISVDILNQLKAQKVMVAIELAGLNARVKACDEMLKEPKKLEISALQSISDMKVKAEIERVGIREKLEQLNSYIGAGESRESTQGTVAKLRAQFAEQMRMASGVLSQAEMMTKLYDLYDSMPLKDDRITISPVEWTN